MKKTKWGIITILLGIIITPILLAMLMNVWPFMYIPGENSDWFSFLGGYVGAIITIGGVYWQVRKQTVADKEADFREARPLFLISIVKRPIEYRVKYYTNLEETDIEFALNSSSKETYNQLKILNISERLMSAVKVEFIWNSGSKDVVNIEYIEPKKEYRVVDGKTAELIYLDHHTGGNKDLLDEVFENLKYVNVYFHTSLREKIKLTFQKQNDELIYTSKHLENKDGDMPEYTLDNFHESQSMTK